MAQIENAAVIENNPLVDNAMIIANSFKEKACLPWFKGTKALCEGKGKAAFKKAAEKRLKAFEAFAATEGGDPTSFSESGPLCEITRSAWAIADSASKSDPTGTTPMGALGVGLGISDSGSIQLFKDALVQATTWAARQIANEKSQAAAKAQAKAQAEEDVESIFDAFFSEDVDRIWKNPKSSDEELLNATKTICLRIQKFLRQELSEIEKNGKGIVARAEAIYGEIQVVESDLRQGLSDKALHSVDADGVKIWISNNIQPATTARRILENCQIKTSALQSKADRTLARLRASQGVGQITW